jgi:hypothetical protein
MNIRRDIPGSSNGFTVATSQNRRLVNLLKVLDENNSNFYTRQAAIWIVTDGVSNNQLLNTLTSGGRSVITQSHIDEARRLLAVADAR